MERISRWGPVVVWMALIFFLSDQPSLPSPEERWLDFVFEKSAHTFEFAVLAVLFLRALAVKRAESWRSVAGALVLAWLFALSDEFHQLYVPGRSSDWSDLLFDWLGAGVGVWLWLRWRTSRSGVEQS